MTYQVGSACLEETNTAFSVALLHPQDPPREGSIIFATPVILAISLKGSADRRFAALLRGHPRWRAWCGVLAHFGSEARRGLADSFGSPSA